MALHRRERRRRAARPAGTVENSTAKPSIPTIEVVGTWDDLVIREIRAYRDRVEPKDRHRLYQVEGVWHMSGDDDGVQGFQYTAESRMKLDKDVADAMGESPSYIPTVREAFDHLVRWVEKGTAAASKSDRQAKHQASLTVRVRTRIHRHHGALGDLTNNSVAPCFRDPYVYSVGCLLCHSVACSYAKRDAAHRRFVVQAAR